jgi:hypothetical protein
MHIHKTHEVLSLPLKRPPTHSTVPAVLCVQQQLHNIGAQEVLKKIIQMRGVGSRVTSHHDMYCICAVYVCGAVHHREACRVQQKLKIAF